MVYQGFDILHGFFFAGRRRQRMIRLIVTRRHVIQTLLDNPETLAHFLNPDRAAVVTIPVDCDGNVKSKFS